jgi:hypothetical protein
MKTKQDFLEQEFKRLSKEMAVIAKEIEDNLNEIAKIRDTKPFLQPNECQMKQSDRACYYNTDGKTNKLCVNCKFLTK